MIILSITNIKAFMSHLLSHETFDEWLVSEITIRTHNTFQIDGNLNKDFFDEENLPDTLKTPWSMLRPICFNIIKGQKVPSLIKMVFLLDNKHTEKIIEECGTFSISDVNALFINIYYEHGKLSITTGSSLKLFTLDKSLDETFEKYVKTFLSSNGLDYEFM